MLYFSTNFVLPFQKEEEPPAEPEPAVNLILIFFFSQNLHFKLSSFFFPFFLSKMGLSFSKLKSIGTSKVLLKWVPKLMSASISTFFISELRTYLRKLIPSLLFIFIWICLATIYLFLNLGIFRVLATCCYSTQMNSRILYF